MSEQMDERNGLGTPEQAAEISSDALVAILQIKRSVKVVYERIATLTAERDALQATLRQGAESDVDLRTKYEALEKERDDLKAQVARLSAPYEKSDVSVLALILCALHEGIQPPTEADIVAAMNAINSARTAPAKETE